jgi:conjugative transposon TraM protein
MNTNKSSQLNDELTKMTGKQRELMKKYAIYAAMALIFGGCMYWIFSPSKDDKANREAQSGFNAEIPMPKEEGLISDKRSAYEQEQMRQRQSERMRSLQDFSAMIGGETQKTDELTLMPDEPLIIDERATYGSGSNSGRQTAINNSTAAYRDINRSLGNFYERPHEDPEKESLKQELEELKARMHESEKSRNTVDEQLELMERSFEMASRYMPGFSGTGTTLTASPFANTTDFSMSSETEESETPARTVSMPVERYQEQEVTVLLGGLSDAEFIEMFSKPRNLGFLTAAGNEARASKKNTVFACVHTNQTVTNGQIVRLRLLEALWVGNVLVPRNSLLTGTARIQGERLGITISSVENEGAVLPVAITVYDIDGQSGIFIPNMQELNAAKEIVANMGTNAGTSINLSNDAEKQFIADMGRNVIQGVSQFTAKKLREVKVHLKAGYKVYLIPDANLKTNNQSNLANR